jgi:alcohol dehydrogenase, propanol-preferring
MKAMLLRRIAAIDSSPLELVDLPTPEPGPGEVLLRVRCCAVCRTDLHVIEGDLPQQKLPVIPGHQIVGTIEKLGPALAERKPLAVSQEEGPEIAPLRIGQRVGVAWLRHTCGHCGFCTAGKENLCESARFTGYHADGGYAEYAVAPAAFCYELPENLPSPFGRGGEGGSQVEALTLTLSQRERGPYCFSDVDAAPLLCSGIIGYRALRRCNLPPGGRLALYGFGSSAHVVIQIAIHRGCEVYVVTRGENHRELARGMGAVWVGEDARQMPVTVDSAIMFAPAGELVLPALESLKKGGTLSLAGIYMTPIPQMDYERYVFYERDIHSVTCNTRRDGRELLAEAAAIPIRPHTTLYPLADANRALRDLKSDRISGTGVLTMDGWPGCL